MPIRMMRIHIPTSVVMYAYWSCSCKSYELSELGRTHQSLQFSVALHSVFIYSLSRTVPVIIIPQSLFFYFLSIFMDNLLILYLCPRRQMQGTAHPCTFPTVMFSPLKMYPNLRKRLKTSCQNKNQ